MSRDRNRFYKEIVLKQKQQNQQLEELEKQLEETNRRLEEMTSLMRAVVVNYILADLEESMKQIEEKADS